MDTSNLQFAFKAKHSTTICASVLKEVISYYKNRGSDVYCCLVDATEAFDRLKFGKLFTVLLKKSLPAPVVHILYEMYISQHIYVR